MLNFKVPFLSLLGVFCIVEPILSQTTVSIRPTWAQCNRDLVSVDLDCPVGWSVFEAKCYQFTIYPRLDYLTARAKCGDNGARLLRIDNLKQHEFISNYLSTRIQDQSILWYTAGAMNPQTFGKFIWEGHPTSVSEFSTIVQSIFSDRLPREEEKDQWDMKRNQVLYFWNGREYRWAIQNGTAQRAYICEAEKVILNKLIADQRTPDFGVADPLNVPRGPCLNQDPEDPWFVPKLSSSEYVVFECKAYANPPATYKWYRLDQTGMIRTLIEPLKDTTGLISQTGGKLVLHDPSSNRDSARHQCEATNDLGSVLSRTAQIVFGMLDEFEKQPRDPLRVNAHTGVILECKAPKHQPEGSLSYSFYMIRDGRQEPVDSTLRRNLFVSQARGELGFSDVTTQDSGVYVCMISMNGGKGVLQDSRKSPDIPLIVSEQVSPEQKTIIQDGYPAIKPASPLRGDLVRLECFAYGTAIQSRLIYRWLREDQEMPNKASLVDFDRVLLIPNVQAEDQGFYKCQAQDHRGQLSSWQRVFLSFKAPPYFLNAPTDQFVDNGQKVELVCEGAGQPKPYLYWYRNGIRINEVSNRADYEVVERDVPRATLKINAATVEHSAMYGCEAQNDLGSEFSYAQVKVYHFAPSFAKYPRLPMEGMVSGHVILVCKPEAAPGAGIEWLFKDGVIGTIPVTRSNIDGSIDCKAKYCSLANKNLFITKLETADTGMYTCRATNDLGVAESSALLEVVDKLAISLYPNSRVVQVNTTVDLPCRAVSSAHLDINYAWKFEGIEIKFDRLDLDERRYEIAQFDREYGRYFGNMRIRNIQFENEGNYSCLVETSVFREEKWAMIRVAGPPGPCAGVDVPQVLNQTEVPLSWTSGAKHQGVIQYFVLETMSQLDYNNLELQNKWTVHVLKLMDTEDKVRRELEDGKDLGRRHYSLGGLAANMGYRVRIRAANQFGVGEFSPASDWFTTLPTPPAKTPMNVSGGGGKEGTLVIRWDPLAIVDQNAPGFFYEVGYRETGNKEFDVKKFTEKDYKVLEDINYLEATFVVGSKKPYAPYQARVRANNNKGAGPWSATADIRSAEVVPKSTPMDVQAGAFNSTALVVSWTPPALPAEEGKLLGYRIVYWPRQAQCTTQQANEDRFKNGQRQTIFGEMSDGTMVGLDPDTYYCIAVQVFNTAGDGPRSGYTEQTTFKLAPQNFPTKVEVAHTGRPNEVKVIWVGLQARPQEESLDGYKIRYWQAGASLKENPRDIDCGLDTSGFIQGLSHNMRYNMRVFGYSRGGVGKMSSPMVQFMIIPADRCIHNAQWEGPDIRYVFICGSCNLKASLATILVFASVIHWFHRNGM